MFIVSTARGINLVFSDLRDLETHVNNLVEYYEHCRRNPDTKPPVYGVYPSDFDQEQAALMVKSLQNIFDLTPKPQEKDEGTGSII